MYIFTVSLIESTGQTVTLVPLPVLATYQADNSAFTNTIRRFCANCVSVECLVVWSMHSHKPKFPLTREICLTLAQIPSFHKPRFGVLVFRQFPIHGFGKDLHYDYLPGAVWNKLLTDSSGVLKNNEAEALYSPSWQNI